MPAVRQAVSGDWPDIHALLAALHAAHQRNRPDIYLAAELLPFEEYIAQLADPAHAYLVAYNADNEIVGYAHIIVSQTRRTEATRARVRANLEELCVKEGHRRQGAGTALLVAAENTARLAGAETMELTVWAFNEQARAFYERRGLQAARSILEKRL